MFGSDGWTDDTGFGGGVRLLLFPKLHLLGVRWSRVVVGRLVVMRCFCVAVCEEGGGCLRGLHLRGDACD